ncbi:MAG TPA: cell envelope integrity protein TolA [Methyloceanibacter sp.]|jgi:outer membrane biosynthesis protein TonB|nr:cell envelope integrity protein TolA [Methyloceanibacter sp.]
MGRGTFISAALHGAILLWVLVAFPPSNLDKAPLVAIPIDLASQGDVTKIKAGTKDAKDDGVLAGKPEEKKPEAAKEAKPPEQTASLDDKADDKKAKPKDEAAAKPDTQKQNDKTAKDPKQAAADQPKKPKPQAKKRDFNPDKIAALLNKIPDAADDPKPVMPDDGTPPKKVKGQTNGTEITMSVNEIDALRARIADCWTPPPGGLGADQIVVKLRLKLNEDGTLVGYPTVANSGSSPFFQAAADSAVRAVYQCQPYELPKAKYALWRDMILNFDPSDMYRSG